MRYIFYWLMIVLPIWQDSPLKSSLGSYGYSFVPLLSLVACVPFLLLTMHKRLVRRGTFTDVWWRLLFYLIAINIIADLVWVLTGNSTVLKGEDIMSKSLRGLLTALSIGSYLMIVSYLAKGYDEERVTRPFFHAFVILTVIAIVEYIQLPHGPITRASSPITGRDSSRPRPPGPHLSSLSTAAWRYIIALK